MEVFARLNSLKVIFLDLWHTAVVDVAQMWSNALNLSFPPKHNENGFVDEDGTTFVTSKSIMRIFDFSSRAVFQIWTTKFLGLQIVK